MEEIMANQACEICFVNLTCLIRHTSFIGGIMEPEKVLETVAKEVAGCQLCVLKHSRKRAVPGEGPTTAEIMFIGEGPGFYENEQGRPFVGAAGKFLDELLAEIGMKREQVYITNVVKCRPPKNRVPLPGEAEACLPYLRMQAALVRPQIILLLGSTAARTVLGDEVRITRDRGKFISRKGVWMMMTYHPSALLRDAQKKKDAWKDLQAVRQKLMELHLYDDLLEDNRK
jgi:DNA polymerase